MRKGWPGVSRVISGLMLISASTLFGCSGGGGEEQQTNRSPVVDVSGPASVVERNSFALVANATDADGSITSYAWTISGDNVSILSGQNSRTLNLKANDLNADATVNISVKVTDNKGATATKTHELTIHRIAESLSISGLVTDEPIPFATVTISVGTDSFSTQANEQGLYSIDLLVDEENIDSLVRLVAVGNPDTHSSLKFVSQLFSFSSLKSLANSNDELSSNEFFKLNVTNVTTAEYALLVEQNGGNTDFSEAQLESYSDNIDLVELIELAALIKLIVDDSGFDLPDGKIDIVDFAIDSDAVNAYLEEVESNNVELFQQTMLKITADENLYEEDTYSNDIDSDGVANNSDAFPFDASESLDSDSDGIGDNADNDDDNDGVEDIDDEFPFDASENTDTDKDGLGNNVDTDDDNDGLEDSLDAFPLDPGETQDTDNDGIGNNSDTDDDNDGVNDIDDAFPFDPSESVDTDSDGKGNNSDPDDDNDGVEDSQDAFPLDPLETKDFDEDGIGNNADTDDDNDGVNDIDDAFPFDPTQSADNDNDNIGDSNDPDDDNDGVEDPDDAFPFDPTESEDNDKDGIGNNADTDDDNDGVMDSEDAFPLDANETVDTDKDGIGNNADEDDDNDGVIDSDDAFPFDKDETEDSDKDGVGDNADTDDDNDGIEDSQDAFPLDPTESVDTDMDGIGNNSDTDDDNDGVSDLEDAFPLNPQETVDTDGDLIGNNSDLDDDNDGTSDEEDAFPLDSSESVDTDSDGTGNNADTDDDNDGTADDDDAFPLDENESVDTDSDGTGNNADTDDDNDGIADTEDGYPLIPIGSLPDTDSDGIPNECDETCQDLGMTSDEDDDGNGIPDAEEETNPVSVTITSPSSLATVGVATIDVTGTVSPNNATVVLNGTEIEHSDGVFSGQVSLEEGGNIIQVRASLNGVVQTDSVSVALDTTEPYITVDSHTDKQVVYTETITVTGLINDVVRGTVGAEKATVSVNGESATVKNRSYAASIALDEGENVIEVSGADQVGNIGTKSIIVTYKKPQGKNIQLVSGQAQAAKINSALADPLLIVVTDEEGDPLSDTAVVFRVVQGDGVIINDDADNTRAKVIKTNTDGQASVEFAVGSRVGQLNQKVRASVVGLEANVVFAASTESNDASLISVNTGNNQRGAVGQRLPQPLVVYVTDDGSNPIEGAAVTFTVESGGGHFSEDVTEVTVTSGEDGFASAEYWLGAKLGGDAQRIKATLVTTNTEVEVSSEFTATAYVPADAGSTSLSGLVLNTEGNPLVGVTVSIEGTSRQSETDEKGYFALTETPVGSVHLLIDGSTITNYAGEFPTLSFHPVLIAGIENTLSQPVYMVKLSDTNQAFVSETQDAVVTMAEFPGYKLEIAANSATFPDGSKQGIVSISPVNTNRVPMAPPNGMQPQLAVTIQPSGTRFDPPAKITLPNLDGLPAGKQVDMYSFDHDLNEFVSIGLGTVNEDASLVVSNPGVGILKAGWFITPQPPSGEGDVENDPNADPNDEGTEPPEECAAWDLICKAKQLGEKIGDAVEDLIDDLSSCDEGELCDFLKNSAQDFLDSAGDVISDTADKVAEGIDKLIEGGKELAKEAFDKVAEASDWVMEQAQRGLDPIVMATGELEFSQTDLKIPGRGFDFELKRTYRSKIHFNGRVGYNWVFNYYQLLSVPNAESTNQDILRVMPNGLQYTYTYNDDGSYTSPDSIFDVLSKNTNGSFTIRQPNGFKINYDTNGQMISQQDRFGNVMEFIYDDEQRLAKVIDTLGREIVFSYRTDSGHIDTVTDFNGRSVRYYYDENRDLIAARTPVVANTPNGNDFTNGKFTQYSYSSGFDEEDPVLKHANHNLLEVTDAKGYVYLRNVYNNDPTSYEFDKIVEQQYGDDSQVFYASYVPLNADAQNVTANTPQNQTTVTDRNGNLIEYIHNQGGMLLSEKHFTNRDINPNDPDNFTTTYTYNDDGLLLSKTLPEGNAVSYTYDSSNSQRYMQRNLLTATSTPGSRGASQSNLVESFTYEPVYTLITSTTNRRGYTTKYTYDYQHQSNLAALAAELNLTQDDVTALLNENNVALTGGVEGQIGGNVVREERPTATLANGDSQSVVITRSYNDFGQLVEEVDAEGIATQISYYGENDPDGDGIETDSTRTLSSVSGGYKKSVIQDAYITESRTRSAELANATTSYGYDPVGNIISQTDGRGNTTTFVRNALNQIVREIAPEPFEYLTDYYYDANNNLVRVSQQNVGTTGSNLSGWVHTVYGYNALNDKVSQTQIPEEGVYLTTTYEYDKNQNLVAIQQPEGNRVERIYDERDQVYQSTRGAGTDVASTTTMHYDGNGNLKSSTDAADNTGDGTPETTIFIYDGYDRLIRATDPLGNYTAYSFDANSNTLSERHYGNSGIEGIDNTILLSETLFSYDEQDRLYQRDDSLLVNGITQNVGSGLTPDDNKVTTVNLFDANGLVVATTDDNGNTTLVTYDGLNRKVTNTDALGNTTSTSYDANSNLVQVAVTQTSAEGLVADKTISFTAAYDELNRKISETDALGNTTTWRYDSRDNVVLQTDAMGNITLNIYDGINRLLESREYLSVTGTGDGGVDTTNPTNPDGINSTYYGYDGNSRLVFQADDKGNGTTYTFDALDRKTTTTYADGTEVSVSFDADDNAISVTDQNGSVFSHEYDGLNRLTGISVVPASGVVGSTQWAYSYDGMSRRISASDNNDPSIDSDDALVTYRYNSFNHKLSETSNKVTTKASYDGLGLPQALTYGNGRTLQYSYDNIYNLKAITENDSNIVEYDYAGRRVLQRRYQNNTTLSYIQDGTDTGYDGINRVLTHSHTTSDDTLIAGFDYAYDKANNRRYEIDRFSQLADVYEYDSAYRLTRTAYGVAATNTNLLAVVNNDNTNTSVAPIIAGQDESYLLDGVGNWVSVQTLAGSDSDAVGYQTNEMNEYSRIGAADQSYDNNGNLLSDGSRNYRYDARNRLVQVTTLSGNIIASYKYDAFGRRTVKRAGTDAIYYVYWGKQVFEERNNFSQLQRQYVYGNGIDEVLQLRNAANDDYYYHDNSIGSIAAITNASGEVVERYRYNAYGETTILAANGIDTFATSQTGNSYAYTGRRLDIETGFYYYRARYYSPQTGRFIQRDPLGYADGMGVYAYVGNNPINFVDPDGKLAHIAFGAIVGGIAGVVSQGVTDLVKGELSGFSDYAGSVVGGVTTGSIAAATGGASLVAGVGAGLTGGAFGNITKQGIDIKFSGKNFNAVDFAQSTAVGGLFGGAASKLSGLIKIPGINKGRNSFDAIGKSIMTKLKNKNISLLGVSAKSGMKKISADLLNGSYLDVAKELLNEGIDNVQKAYENIRDGIKK